MDDRARDVLNVQASTPDVTDHVLLIPVHEIEIGDRLRPVDRVWAEGLGRLMQTEGQLTPIEVCRLPGKSKYTVVSGGHRRVGAEMAGLAYLKAIVVTSERAERRMREISENLLRKGLDPIDRAAFIGEIYDLLRARLGIDPDKDGRAVSIAARWQKAVQSEADDTTAIIADVYGINAQIRERLGLSERTIRNDLALRRRLSETDVAPLREADHPVLRNGAQLLALAKLDEEARGEAVKLLVGGKAKSVAEATALHSKKPKPSPEAKLLSAFIGSFNRMSLTEKKGALIQLGGMLSPALVEALAGAIDLPTRAAAPAQDEKYREALIEAISQVRELVDGLIEDEVICDGPSAIVDYDRQDRLRDANGALQLAAMPLYGNHVPLGDPKATQALRSASQALGRLADGAGASDEMIEAAYDACEQALHGCGPAIPNDEVEDDA